MKDNKTLLYDLLEFVSANNYPDIHISTNHKPIFRNESGEIITLASINIKGEEKKLHILNKSDIVEIILVLLGRERYGNFLDDFESDTSFRVEGGERFRVNCYSDNEGFSIAMRLIPSKVPTMEDLGLGAQIKNICNKSKGLFIMTGPTGVGKSTNLAAMIDYINKNFKKHIITIEDPIEFIFKSDKSLINQREVGTNTESFSKALKASMREDPDVIMIGEMRDPETIKTALTLAETGHLVFSTLHTNDCPQTIDRIVDIFPENKQKQVRMQLAMSLLGIMSQRLLPKKGVEGRIAAREILITNDAIKNMIIEGKTHQIYSVIEVGIKEGMILMDKYLITLYEKGLIDIDILFSYVRDKEAAKMLINNNK
ncbi:type IV pili twitching motility protein PilT [Candidatus Gracilibacteria bacterium]|nr:MAG: type IV pili twitching motility protein PilT [Candidatus Gracilibacteria bacterium]PIE85766.1 MAG: type IV pili twitching motility protein PilT [Candidatus Gracilibacteria bacterium]